MGIVMDPEALRLERRQLAAQARESLYPTLTAEDVEELKKQVCEVLADTFKAAVEMSVHFQVRKLTHSAAEGLN